MKKRSTPLTVTEMTAGIAGPQPKPADIKAERRAFEEGVAADVMREMEEQNREKPATTRQS